MSVELSIAGCGLPSGVREPIAVGVPFPAGACADDGLLRVCDPLGSELVVQTSTLDRWRDGSVRWALVHFTRTEAVPAYRIVAGATARPTFATRLAVKDDGGAVLVDTGVATFSFARGASSVFTSAAVATGGERLDQRCDLIVEDQKGRQLETIVQDVEVEETGSLSCSVNVRGIIGRSRRTHLEWSARLLFAADAAEARIAVTVRNPRAARHRGGFWELGDRGSVYVRDVALSFTASRPAETAWCSLERDTPLRPCGLEWELYQDSSGGENWAGSVHVNRDGRVPEAFRGYRVRSADGTRGEGLRATPHVAVAGSSWWMSVATTHFWQNCPKALEIDHGRIVFRLWPGQYSDLHELQAGEQKTHTLIAAMSAGRFEPAAIQWWRTPAVAAAAPEWYVGSGAVPQLLDASASTRADYLRLADLAIEGPQSFEAKREVVDEYGWRNFGDLYADHEAAFHHGERPLVSHYNNQYDAIAGLGWHFLRTGDRRWWTAMSELAAHVIDIDIYHTSKDRALYNHGLFWHTCHYTDAARSTHRTYPTAPSSSGGGPSAEHNYATGLALHYFLTGDRESRQAVVDLAHWVLAMDDGRRTPYWWIARGPTGWATATFSLDFQGPGRGAGHSVGVLLEGHRLTKEPAFLAKVEEIIRRCIHPDDDPASRNLLDVERRWSYTVFLQALGRYLHYKEELGEIDSMYTYAREALLAYARWIAVHERPYLERPEILEYPDETWAAQDLRKAHVLMSAAEYAPGADAERYRARGQWFLDYAIGHVKQVPVMRTRPLVLLLVNGLTTRRAAGASVKVAAPRPSFAREAPFVPQKALVLRRLRVAAAASAAACVAAVVMWLFR